MNGKTVEKGSTGNYVRRVPVYEDTIWTFSKDKIEDNIGIYCTSMLLRNVRTVLLYLVITE
jgi:hypothetical protein